MVEKAEMTPWALAKRTFSASKIIRLNVTRESLSFAVISLSFSL
jgi:hypothetical protein